MIEPFSNQVVIYFTLMMERYVIVIHDNNPVIHAFTLFMIMPLNLSRTLLEPLMSLKDRIVIIPVAYEMIFTTHDVQRFKTCILEFV